MYYKQERAEAIKNKTLFLGYKNIHINTMENWATLNKVIILVPHTNHITFNHLKVKHLIEKDIKMLNFKSIGNELYKVKIMTHHEFKQCYKSHPYFTIYLNGKEIKLNKSKISIKQLFNLANVNKDNYYKYYIDISYPEPMSEMNDYTDGYTLSPNTLNHSYYVANEMKIEINKLPNNTIIKSLKSSISDIDTEIQELKEEISYIDDNDDYELAKSRLEQLEHRNNQYIQYIFNLKEEGKDE